MDKLLEKIQNPPAEYRSLPFWAWNDKLDPEVLRWQIREMKKSGIGGYFMHARGGLKTEYLSEEWFDCIKTSMEEGEKEGLASWVYDEEGWPSGFAGGKVTAMGPKYYARGLGFEKVLHLDEIQRGEDVLGVFGYQGDCITPEAELDPETEYEGYYVMRDTYSPYYVDVMNQEVIAAFLKTTHEEYYKRFGDEMPQALKGFFTDEPRLSQGPVPWSRILPEEFQKRFGYDICKCLPALYVPCQNYQKIRFDFWSLVCELFVSSYMKQIHDWCKIHNCQLTGHMMMEESIFSQMTGTSGSMPFYEYMDIPGVDSLRRMINDPRIPKQVGSVAEQLGKKFVLSESFAMGGWDMNFEEMRWIAGWQFVNGVNLICEHLEAYSLKGLRKRDYPPSLFYQQTWWQEYQRFMDYLARLSVLLTEGTKLVDVLLIHPMHSGWISYDGTNNETIRKLDVDFIRASETLSGLHIDYHFGDETLIRKYGSVENGKLQVGNGSYTAVVLPSMITIDSSTLDLLEKFTEQGGLIVSFGDFPDLCNGIPSGRLDSFQSHVKSADSSEDLQTFLTPVLTNPVSLSENGGEITDLSCCTRRTENGDLLYVVNNSKINAHQMLVRFRGSYKVELLDLETASAFPVTAWYEDGKTCFRKKILPMGQFMFRLIPCDPGDEKPCLKKNSERQQILSFQEGRWDLCEVDTNALTLDFCEYRIDGGVWEERIPVILLMKKLLEKKCDCNIEMRFTFDMEMDPQKAGDLYLVVEQPEQFQIQMNGMLVSHREADGFYKDIAFRKISVSSAVKRGKNEIIMAAQFHQSPHVYETLFGENVYETELNKLTYDMELESIYLIGKFGVYPDRPMLSAERCGLWHCGGFTLRELPKDLRYGSFTQQGFAFFAGRMKVSRTISVKKHPEERVIVDLGIPRAAVVKLFINGQWIKTCFWRPYRCDVTDVIQDGENQITVELYSSNRNLLGPHHNIKGELYGVGPLHFSGVYSWADRESEAVEMEPDLENVSFWTDAYSFVTFGI